ncbi:MAG: tetratricopeptide repeat protein [Verrucomicrobiota bacterium]
MKASTGKKAQPKAGPAPISGRRRWSFRAFSLVVVPLILLGGLEIGLRLAGYGYSPAFFQKVRVNDQEYLINNEDFTRRFFPPQLLRWPGPVMFEAQKPPNTFRIFVLGESAARGEPEPAWAASRYLEALLAERFPNTRFEVINLGITAINSHVILPLARDCARADGDLWIIYMGNNEMVGPFGAATVFGSKAPPLPLVRLNLALLKTRVGQFLAEAGQRLSKRNPTASWGGMKMFLGNQLRADDPRKEIVYRSFGRNLDDILRAGFDSGARILLNTVAVNLKDCPPFASLTNASLPAADSARFTSAYSAACRAQETREFAGAAGEFAAAATIDAQHAELQFRWAECLEQMGQGASAREHYQLACDDDALPFRADSRLNQIIAAAGKRSAGDRLVFFDAAAALARQGTNGICGQETFYEHVHFNFDGNFRLGRAWAAQLEPLLPPEILRSAVTNGWASQGICERRLGLTDGNRCGVTERMIDRLGRPPFSSQLNHLGQLQQLREEAMVLSRQISPAPARAAAGEIYLSAIRGAPTDFLLYENFAEFLESEGNLQPAISQWRRVGELLPYSCDAFYQAGRLFNEAAQWSDAETSLAKAVALRPQSAESWYELGNAHFGSGNFQLAFRNLTRAIQLAPSEGMYHALAGRALSKLNRHHEAIQYYRRALEIRPDFEKLWVALGDELTGASQIAEAKEAYTQAARLKPDDPRAHLDLGVMLARLGQFDEATREFEDTLRLEPANQPAHEYLNRIQGARQQQNLKH